ncbi:hypothetical protein WA158_000446 [Blastocystis sp. Blastoise]
MSVSMCPKDYLPSKESLCCPEYSEQDLIQFHKQPKIIQAENFLASITMAGGGIVSATSTSPAPGHTIYSPASFHNLNSLINQSQGLGTCIAFGIQKKSPIPLFMTTILPFTTDEDDDDDDIDDIASKQHSALDDYIYNSHVKEKGDVLEQEDPGVSYKNCLSSYMELNGKSKDLLQLNYVYLDNACIQYNKYYSVMQFPGIVSTIIPYIPEQKLKQELNHQFQDTYPHIPPSFTYLYIYIYIITKAITLCEISVTVEKYETDLIYDAGTLGLAFAYFEQLVNQRYVYKKNRKLYMSVCILLAYKFAQQREIEDPEEGLNALFTHLERIYGISRDDIIQSEMIIFSELGFSLHRPLTEFMKHVNYIFKELETNLSNYLGESMHHSYIQCCSYVFKNESGDFSSQQSFLDFPISSDEGEYSTHSEDEEFLVNSSISENKMADIDITEDQVALFDGIGNWSKRKDLDGSVHSVFVRGEDCYGCVKDIQRMLRRENSFDRSFSVLLGNHNILNTKLLPLFTSCYQEKKISFSLIKIFVMFTMPLEEKCENYDIILNHCRKSLDAVIQQDFLSCLMKILEDPLSRESKDRSKEETILLELILTLIRNLVAIPSTDITVGNAGYHNNYIHIEFVKSLQEHLVMDTLSLIAQEEGSESFCLLLLEIYTYIFTEITPQQVFFAHYKGLHLDKDEKSIYLNPSQYDPSNISFSEVIQQQSLKSLSASSSLSLRPSSFSSSLMTKTSFGTLTLKKHQPAPSLLTSSRSAGSHVFSSTRSVPPSLLRILYSISYAFITDAFSYVFMNVKREFQSNSIRVLPLDQVHFIQLLTYSLRFIYMHLIYNKINDNETPLEMSMFQCALDAYTFSYIIKCCELYTDDTLQFSFHLDAALLCLQTIMDAWKRKTGLDMLRKLVLCMDSLIKIVENMNERNVSIIKKKRYIHKKKPTDKLAGNDLDDLLAATGQNAGDAAVSTEENPNNEDIPADIPTDISTDIPTDIPVKDTNDIPVNISTDISEISESNNNSEIPKEEEKGEEISLETVDNHGNEDVQNAPNDLTVVENKENSPGDEDNNNNNNEDEDNNNNEDEENDDDDDDDDDMMMRYKEMNFNKELFYSIIYVNVFLSQYTLLISSYKTNPMSLNICLYNYFKGLSIYSEKNISYMPLLYYYKLFISFNEILSDPLCKSSLVINKSLTNTRVDLLKLFDLADSVMSSFFHSLKDHPILVAEALALRPFSITAMISRGYQPELKAIYSSKVVLNDTTDHHIEAVEGEKELSDSDLNMPAEVTPALEELNKKSKRRRMAFLKKSNPEEYEKEKEKESLRRENERKQRKKRHQDPLGDSSEEDLPIDALPSSPRRRVRHPIVWTAEEDEVIKEKYEDIHDLDSRYAILSLMDELACHHRTPNQVKEHVQQLGLEQGTSSTRRTHQMKLRHKKVTLENLEEDYEELVKEKEDRNNHGDSNESDAEFSFDSDDSNATNTIRKDDSSEKENEEEKEKETFFDTNTEDKKKHKTRLVKHINESDSSDDMFSDNSDSEEVSSLAQKRTADDIEDDNIDKQTEESLPSKKKMTYILDSEEEEEE